MSENTFDSQEINLQLQPLPAFIDSDGSFKLNTPMLSSFDFDGSIPKYEGEINAIEVKAGYSIQLESGGEYFPVISTEFDEPGIDDTGIVIINYLDDQGNTSSLQYLEDDQVSVLYENWNDKSIGSQGWGITAGGNAIFTNVAVRGRIEAEEGYISGNLTIGSGGTTTLDDVATTDDLDGFITGPEVNTNVTSISGGVITSGRIKSSGYNGPVSGGGSFSTIGSQLNLDDGTFVSPGVRIDSSGNAFFVGNITGSSITGSTINTGPSNALVTIAQYFNGRQNQGYIQFTDDWYGGTYFIAPANPPNGPALQLSGNLRLSGNLVVPPGYTISGNGSGLNNVPAPANVVLTTGTYSNPSWITSLAGSKISGNISGNANNITQYNINQNVGSNNSPTFSSISALPSQGAGQGTHYLHWNSTGGTVTRSTALPSGSSRELKDEITLFPVDDEWTKSVTDIYTFKYKSDINDFGSASAPTQLGIIIDEILDIDEIQPLIFEVNGTKAFDYTKVGVLLIPVINSLIKKIDDLQDRVLQLESQLGG